MTDVTQTQQPANEVSEMNINDIFDFYSSGNTSISKSLGYGSLGAVFQATRRDKDISTNIAIKPFSCTRALFEDLQKRVNESDIFQNSKNVLQFKVKQLAESGDNIATVFEMELCQKSLFKYINEIKEGSVTPTKAEILILVIQALNGIHELSESGNNHFNLKPHNVLINDEDTIKLSDAGLTNEISQMIYNKPLQYNRFLSLNYLSPEYMSIIDGKKDVQVDVSSDIFSLGVIFLELLGQDINIVTSIKLKSGIFEGVTVKEQYQDLANIIFDQMLCTLPEDRKTTQELIEVFSEQFFFEITKFNVSTPLETKTQTIEVVEQVLTEAVEEKTEVVEEKTEIVEEMTEVVEEEPTVKTTLIKVSDNEDEEAVDQDDEDENEEQGTPKKDQLSDGEYEILEEDQDVVPSYPRTSAKKNDDEIQPSQDSTLDQEAIEMDNQNTQESERLIESQQQTENVTEEKLENQEQTIPAQNEETDVEFMQQTQEQEVVVDKIDETTTTQNVEEITSETAAINAIDETVTQKVDEVAVEPIITEKVEEVVEETVTETVTEQQVEETTTETVEEVAIETVEEVVTETVEEATTEAVEEVVAETVEEVATEAVIEKSEQVVDAETLKKNKQITRIERLRLDFNSQILVEERFVTLFRELEVFTSLSHLTLNLVNTQVDDNSIAVLSEFLTKFTNLITLSLRLDENKLTPASLTTLNTALSTFTNLTTFEITLGKQLKQDYQQWETESIKLVEVLKTWSTLKRITLGLNGVKVSNGLVEFFTQYLKEYTTLTALTLDFDTSNVNEDVANEFVNTVEAYTTLTTVKLPFTQKKVEVIETAIQEKTHLLIEETNEVVEETNQVVEETNEVVEETNEVVEETNEVVKEVNVVVQETNEVVEETKEIVEEVNEVVGQTEQVVEGQE